MANEVKNLNQAKVDSERKRKQLELNFTDLSHKYQDSERNRVELAEKLNKMQVEIEQMRTVNIDNESKAMQNERVALGFKTQLAEFYEANQEEIRQKLALQTKLRSIEDENNSLKEHLEERNEREDKMKMQIKQFNDQVVQMRKQSENEQLLLEQVEDMKRKYGKDSEMWQRELDQMKALNDKIDKSRKKLQNDYGDVSVELEKYKNQLMQVEKQQKNFDKKLTEEKVQREQILVEKEQVCSHVFIMIKQVIGKDLNSTVDP